MKIQSSLKNNKADNAVKRANLLASNGHWVRHSGQSFRIRIATVGGILFANAECGTQNIDLFATTTIAKDIKKLCENRLYT